jgi:hypothetical protein
MVRWVAGLLAVLILPACGGGGGGSGKPFGTGSGEGSDPAGPGNGQMPTVQLSSPATGTSASAGSTVTLQAVVTDPNGVIARVDFYDDNRRIGSAEDPPWTMSTSSLKAGTHELCAVAVDFDGNFVASAPVTLFVVKDGHDERPHHGHDRDP